MATYDVLVFQEERFREEVMKICDEALDKAIEVCRNDPSFQGDEYNIKPYGNGKEATIYSGTLKAWVLEYGAGLDMDTSNPYLGEYFASGLTSGLRSSPYVVRRGSGSYQTLDVESGELVTHQGGDPEGRALPDFWYDEHNINQKPQKFLQKLLEKAYQTFLEIFDSRYNSINIDNFYEKTTITI